MHLLHALLLHRMENEKESAQPCWLLELPDPCLQAVLQCCAADDLPDPCLQAGGSTLACCSSCRS